MHHIWVPRYGSRSASCNNSRYDKDRESAHENDPCNVIHSSDGYRFTFFIHDILFTRCHTSMAELHVPHIAIHVCGIFAKPRSTTKRGAVPRTLPDTEQRDRDCPLHPCCSLAKPIMQSSANSYKLRVPSARGAEDKRSKTARSTSDQAAVREPTREFGMTTSKSVR